MCNILLKDNTLVSAGFGYTHSKLAILSDLLQAGVNRHAIFFTSSNRKQKLTTIIDVQIMTSCVRIINFIVPQLSNAV